MALNIELEYRTTLLGCICLICFYIYMYIRAVLEITAVLLLLTFYVIVALQRSMGYQRKYTYFRMLHFD